MENNQEKFSYDDYKTYQRVARILGEDTKQKPTNSNATGDTEGSDDYDPYAKYKAEQEKLWGDREKKQASITKEQIAEADSILDAIRW